MADTGETQGQEPTTETTPTTNAEAPPVVNDDPWANIPDEWKWTKAEVESARREAASRRVALKELETKLSEAKSPEEFSKAMADAKASEDSLARELSRERAARKHRLDDDLLEFLTGNTDEEIEAKALKLAALKPGAGAAPVVITKPAPSGGSSPLDGVSPEEDGRAEWEAYKKRNRR